ncbi:hypothetical protein NHQ30_002240 [Ciborinia camelliae]|nr:hypothetical protein NHQ30_002240 [Ciborinia camelliae]
MPSKADLFAWVTRCGRPSKLCGNRSCRSPSHTIGGSLEVAESGTSCQDELKEGLKGRPFLHLSLEDVRKRKAIVEVKCSTSHFPPCMRKLTLARNEDTVYNYDTAPTITLSFGQMSVEARVLTGTKVLETTITQPS